MARQRITVIRGDGIGPSITDATLKVLDRLGCGLEYDFALAGQAALDAGSELLPEETLDLLQRNRFALKGPVTTPIGEGFSSINVALRKRFELYANVRPVVSFPGTQSRYDKIDITTVRENTEGMYSGEGQELRDDGERAESLSVVTRTESMRLIRFAFDLARRTGRRKVTVVHKANILKTTSGLFLRCGREVAKEYDDIEMEEMIIDNCAMQLVLHPHRFDLIVTTNLFGDIISDLCAGLVGGLGLAPGGNIGENMAIFEAVHGSAPDIAGKDIANPTAMMLAAGMLLDHLNETDQAERLRTALQNTISDGDRCTPDLGGQGSTTGFTEAVIERL